MAYIARRESGYRERALSPLEIVYRDDRLVVINKPPGLLVHRSPIDRHETRFAVQLLRQQVGQRVWPAHRLDKPTSGLLIFALSADVARNLSTQFAGHTVGKRYLALLRGFCPTALDIDHPVKIPSDAYAPQRTGKATTQLPAQTILRRLARVELPVRVDRYSSSRYALAELFPITGRRHQLRRHMKHISHPILGDANYGKSRHNHFFQQQLNCQRLMLACTGLQFRHPVTGEDVSLQASPGADFLRLARLLDWQWDADATASTLPDQCF